MKYHYEYELRTNNLCWGSKLLGTYRRLNDARKAYWDMNSLDRYGCMDIYKVRVYE